MVAPWVIYAAIAAVSAGVSYVTAKSAQKKAKQASKANEGLLINSEGANNHIPVIYGSRRIAGTRVFVETGPGPRGANDFLYMIFVLCEGEVESITDFLIDDAPTTDPRFAYSDSIAINTYVGTDAQTVDPMFDAAGIGWDTGYDLKGLCYIAVRLKWNPDAFSAIPNITALVTGKKVYDPRTATTAYSTNPALCIRDYLTNERYGKGLDSSLIDDTAITAAANFYDTTVTYWTSGTVGKLFEFNMVLDTEQDILENIKDMLMCCRGFLPYTNGLYQLLPDKSSSSVFAFTTDEIIGGLSIRGESKDEKYNRVACTFIDPENNWQENTAIWPESGSAEETTYLAEDGGVELVGDFDLPCITNYYAARDIARIFLARSRNALRASFVATSEALNLTVGDVVTVTHPTPGWSAKPFQVEQITINYDGTVGVSLLEYDSSIYTYDPASEQVAYADTNLPNPFDVAAPTTFVVTETTYLAADGTVIPEISVAWTAAADAFVAYYEFQFKIDTDSVWNSVVTYEPVYISSFATVGETYDIRSRSVNSAGVRSDWLTGTYTVVGDTAAPAAPTGLAISGDYNQAVLTWDAAAEKDYKETLIYASTTNNSATATLEARISGNTVTVAGLPVSTTYYVWLKNEDFSGNVSAFGTGVSFSTTAGAAASSVVAGATISGSATTDGVAISTVRTNAASGKSISDTLLVSGTATLKGVIQPDTTGAIRTGTITWNSTTGALTGGTGIAITQWGIIGATAGVATFSIEGATGSAVFSGTLSAATGTFSGDISASSGTFGGNISTTGYVWSTGSTLVGSDYASIIAIPTAATANGVYAVTAYALAAVNAQNTATGNAIIGTSGGTGGAGVLAISTHTGGPALNVLNTQSTGVAIQLGGTGRISGDAIFQDDVTINGALVGAAISGTSGTFSGTVGANAITVSSTTRVANLNATRLYDKDWTEYCSLIVGNTGTAYASGAGFNITVGPGMSGSYAFTASSNNVVLDVISDERLKKDIASEALGLDFVNSLRPVTYRMKSGTNMLHHGFIAQDIEAVLGKGENSLTVENAEGVKGLNYTSLIGPMAKAIQELTARIAVLEGKVQ